MIHCMYHRMIRVCLQFRVISSLHRAYPKKTYHQESEGPFSMAGALGGH